MHTDQGFANATRALRLPLVKKPVNAFDWSSRGKAVHGDSPGFRREAHRIMIDLTKLLRGAFLALALLFLAPLTGVGGSIVGVEAAQAATISKISVSGNTKVETSAVIKLLAIHVGDVATSTKINESIQALTASGLFKTVSVTVQGSILVVKVTENPIIASVLFQGNVRFSDDNLVAMIDLMNRGT